MATVVLTYANGLNGPFVLDDQSSVVQNADIQDLSRLGRVLVPQANSPVAGRPVVSLSFALNYAWGGLDVTGYHVVNVALHALCSLLVFALLRRTWASSEGNALPGWASPDGPALAVALIWAVHPLNSEVVDYLTQRTESIMAACLLLTLYAAARAARAVQADRSSHWRWQVTAVVACALGMASKETAVVTPILVVLLNRAFFFTSWRDAVRRRAPLYVGLAGTWIVLGALVASGPRAAVGGPGAGVAVSTYLFNQAAMIVEYIGLAFWPSSLVIFYGWPLPLTLGDVAWQGALVLALLAASIWAWFAAPRWGVWGLWFFVTLAPTSSVIPIATEVGAERRMYLPLVAMTVLIVQGAVALLGVSERAAARRRPSRDAATTPPKPRDVPRAARLGAGALVAVVVVVLAGAAWARTREYASGLTLAETVVARRPTPVARHMLGEQLGLAGRVDEAVVQLRRSAAEGNSRARYSLGMVLLDGQRVDEAARELEAFVATEGVAQVMRWLEPPVLDVWRSRVTLAQVYATQQRWPQAQAHAERVLLAAPAHAEARRLLAAALFGQQRWAEAIAQYRVYIVRNPRDVPALLNLGVALVATEQLPEAVATFRRAVDAEPANASAVRLLEMATRDAAAVGGILRP